MSRKPQLHPVSNDRVVHGAVEDATVLRGGPVRSDLDVADEQAPPSVLKQRFVLEDKIGSGGMGTVYKAKDLRKVEAQDRQPYVAIKVLNNDFRTHPEAFIALEREASKSQQLSHPNIVSIFDFDKDDDLPFIIMELLEGRELSDLLRAYPNGLPEEMAWSVIAGLCDGLGFAHAAGVVHADFKPGNVFVSPQNTAKILDFGIARAVRVNSSYQEDTAFDPAKLAALTPAYASLEMLKGDNPEIRDDIYALGVVIYLVLTGHHPFGRLAATEALQDGLTVERPKGLSGRRWRVLQKCLAFHRQNRPSDVAAIREGLFGHSFWRSKGVLALAATLVVSFGSLLLLEGAEIDEVKAEVRQTTLYEAQLARIDVLLAQPVANEAWFAQIAQEMATLRELDETGESLEQIRPRLSAAFTGFIREAPVLDEALALYRTGLGYVPQPELRPVLMEHAGRELRARVERASSAREAAEVERLLGAMSAVLGGHPDFTALRVELGYLYAETLTERLLVDDAPAALAVYKVAEPLLFAAGRLDDLEAAIGETRDAIAAEQRASAQRGHLARLDRALDRSCLSYDLGELDRLSAVDAGDAFKRTARRRVAAYLTGCVGQLAALDPQRAQQLHAAAQQQFRGWPEVAAIVLDPCGVHYLVGNGAQQGVPSSCRDRLNGFTDETLGPELVVLANPAGGKFALTRAEVSWAEFNRFCSDSGRCQNSLVPELPVAGVSVELVQQFAGWLSERSGFTYRLPTEQEWLIAAQGPVDPNRNCRLRAAGVERGLRALPINSGSLSQFGLLNVLGNVAELVTTAEGHVALGGAYGDPIERCTQDNRRELASQVTHEVGFRLVREVS